VASSSFESDLYGWRSNVGVGSSAVAMLRFVLSRNRELPKV
jgi:hypothetical protein